MKNIEVKISEENEQGMTYLKFSKLVRYLIVEANPSSAHTKINALLGALWSDYKRKKSLGAASSNPTSLKGAGKGKKQKTTPKAAKSTKPVSVDFRINCTVHIKGHHINERVVSFMQLNVI